MQVALFGPEISQTGEKSDEVHPCIIIIIMKLRAVIHLLHAFRKDGVLNANFSNYAARFLAVRAPQVLMVCIYTYMLWPVIPRRVF